jgi:hypothetical protein
MNEFQGVRNVNKVEFESEEKNLLIKGWRLTGGLLISIEQALLGINEEWKPAPLYYKALCYNNPIV